MVDTNLTSLIINRLTKAQYDAALAAGSINANELYFITDDGDEFSTYTTAELDALLDG